jgi:hypothetical protein
MKFFRVALPGLIIVVALLCWIGLSDADSANLWPNKQGELCWSLSPPSGYGTTVQLAIVRTFKDHYIVHGTITEELPGGDYVRCLNGNAEIVGGDVIMHGSTAGIYGDELIGGMGYVTLNLNDLGGTSMGISMWYDISTGPGDAGSVKYDGPVSWTLTQCN